VLLIELYKTATTVSKLPISSVFNSQTKLSTKSRFARSSIHFQLNYKKSQFSIKNSFKVQNLLLARNLLNGFLIQKTKSFSMMNRLLNQSFYLPNDGAGRSLSSDSNPLINSTNSTSPHLQGVCKSIKRSCERKCICCERNQFPGENMLQRAMINCAIN
jgi:hypothetical protein